MMNRLLLLFTALAAAGSAAACATEGAGTTPPAAEQPVRQGVVDSIFPVDEAIRRFQATLPFAPTELENAAASRDELVRCFVAALEAGDRDALVRLVLNRAEYGYLYYEHTRFTRDAYYLPPEILWEQMQNRSGRGLTRLLERIAGQPLGFRGYQCPADAVQEGPNTVWHECTVRYADRQGREVEARLFGTVVERDGRFKFVSYSNDL
jgi:hypothetical protein